MELDIAFFARLTGDDSAAERFSAVSQARFAAINSIFWNAKTSQWLDYWLINNNTCKVTSAYNFIMLTSFNLQTPPFLKYSPFPIPSIRKLMSGKCTIKIETFLHQTSFLYGLSCSTRVSASACIFWHFMVITTHLYTKSSGCFIDCDQLKSWHLGLL